MGMRRVPRQGRRRRAAELAAIGGEALAGLLTRPGRTALTVVGTVLGTAAVVATLGVATTSGNQLVSTFDVFAATSVRVDGSPVITPEGDIQPVLPDDSEQRLSRLNGVIAAGTLSEVAGGGAIASSSEFVEPLAGQRGSSTIVAASPGLFDAVGAQLATGRLFDHGHSARADRVAILGPTMADKLNIHRLDGQPAVFLDDVSLSVIGILGADSRAAVLLDAVTVPEGTAAEIFGHGGPTVAHIRTDVGAAALIGRQAAVALSPVDPDRVRVSVPPEPETLKKSIAETVNTQFLLLGLISAVIGAIGIANVGLVSVLERTGEIGLRRAVGATKWGIGIQFLGEAAGMGLIGGVIGASTGVVSIVVISATQGWTPVFDMRIALLAVPAGTLLGLIAGAYPAWRAATLAPVDALRSSR